MKCKCGGEYKIPHNGIIAGRSFEALRCDSCLRVIPAQRVDSDIIAGLKMMNTLFDPEVDQLMDDMAEDEWDNAAVERMYEEEEPDDFNDDVDEIEADLYHLRIRASDLQNSIDSCDDMDLRAKYREQLREVEDRLVYLAGLTSPLHKIQFMPLNDDEFSNLLSDIEEEEDVFQDTDYFLTASFRIPFDDEITVGDIEVAKEHLLELIRDHYRPESFAEIDSTDIDEEEFMLDTVLHMPQNMSAPMAMDLNFRVQFLGAELAGVSHVDEMYD